MHSEPVDELTVWWKQPLVREITVILAIKFALIFALWWAFFDVPDARHIDEKQVSTHLMGTLPPTLHTSKETPQ